MSLSIEGKWGEFEFRMIQVDDIPAVCNHLKKSFYPDETMFSLVGYTDDLGDEVNLVVEEYIRRNDGLSFLAIHTPSGKLAGVRITFKDEINAERPNTPVTLETHKTVLSFVRKFAMKRDLHEEYGLDAYADLFMTCVDPEFRRRGLVSEMYKRSLELLRNRKYKLVESFFSSPHTRRAAVKHGFKEIDRAYYAEAQDELGGNKQFPNATPDQFVARMIKEL